MKERHWEADSMTRQLNEYGREGWELASQFCPSFDVLGGDSLVFATFKRRLQQ